MGGRRWTTEEEDLLAELWGTHAPRELAKRLGRSEGAIWNQAGAMRLGRGTPPGSLTGNEFQRVLGIDAWAKVKHWIATGVLHATRYMVQGSTKPQWVITEEALIAFLRDHPHLVDRDDVDEAYRQFVPERWITLVQAFRLGAAFPVLLENGVKAGLIPEARRRGEKGTRWAIPVSILPRLVAGRRMFTSDPEHRRLVIAYDRIQRNGNLAKRKADLTRRARAASAGGRSGRDQVAA